MEALEDGGEGGGLLRGCGAVESDADEPGGGCDVTGQSQESGTGAECG